MERLRGLTLWLLGMASGQVMFAQQPEPTLADLDLSVNRWLADDWTVETRRQAVVRQILDTERGLAYLGEQLRAAGEAPSRRRTGLSNLATRVILAFIDRARASGVAFRGQHDALQSMQPYASEALFSLLLRPPDWFASTRRRHLVPAIADLAAAAPDHEIFDEITEVIENAELEPADLRLSLACLVWQWGDRQHVEAELSRLRAASAEGDAEDRLIAMRELANLHYRVRDFGKAASTHRALELMADRADLELMPIDWYWSACYHALGGKIDRGMESLERCVTMLASPLVDSSLKLPESLFRKDPELGLLRADPRFAAIVERAFPPKKKEPSAGKGSGVR